MSAYGQYAGQGNAEASEFGPYKNAKDMVQMGYNNEQQALDKQIENSERLAEMGYADNAAARESTERINNADNASAEAIAAGGWQNNLDQIDANTDAAIKMADAGLAGSGTTAAGTDIKDSKIKSIVKDINSQSQAGYGVDALEQKGTNSYKVANGVGAEYVVKRVYDSNDLTADEKFYVCTTIFGIDPDVIKTYATDTHYSR